MSNADKEKIEYLSRKLFVYEHEASKLIEPNRVGRCLSAFGELASAIKPDMLRSFCKALGDTFTKAESENFCSTFDQFPVPPTREEYLQSEIARLEAECAALRNLARFMCSTWDMIDTYIYSNVDADSLMKYPVIQGTSNQMKLRKIGEQEWTQQGVIAGVQVMLGESAMQAGEKL